MLYMGRVEIGSGVLNVRSAPEGGVIGTLDRGETVQVLADDGDWLCVGFGGGSGYVAKRYVCFDAPAAAPRLVIEDEEGNVFTPVGSIWLRAGAGEID